MLTTAFISGTDDNIDELITSHGLDKKSIQQEFLNASLWCNDLGI